MNKLLVVLVLAFFFVSCETRTYDEISGVAISNPTYVANIKPIVTVNCLECHSSGIQYPNLETYDEVKEQIINGNLLCRISGQSCGDRMPLGGQLPQNQIEAITLWSQNGFINQ
ncbi:MAG: hypothetical protein WC662_01870 [Candidatus Paceibacterota bacterium]|jgi:hypothetical protein